MHHKEPKPTVMLGDRLVLFRDGDGKAWALENRCPHRGPLLSLGQVGITEPGTITCRYHGMTFDGDGECVAFLADGPDSPACGKVRAKSYPIEELGGIVWVYMGEKEPEPVIESVPHAKEVFAWDTILVHQIKLPISYLNTLDNDVDLVHPSVLHRTCVPFSGQKSFGRIKARELECGGLRAVFVDYESHAGSMHIDQIEWHTSNFAFHQPGEMGDVGFGYNWAVLRDVGNCVLWLILVQPGKSWIKQKITKPVERLFFGFSVPWPGSTRRADSADDAMMASQGRIVRWDKDALARPDGPVAKTRRKLKKAYAAEQAERAIRILQRARKATSPKQSAEARSVRDECEQVSVLVGHGSYFE